MTFSLATSTAAQAVIEAERYFSFIKPVNLSDCLIGFFKATSHRQRLGYVIKLLELYDLYWISTLDIFSQVGTLLVNAIQMVPKVFSTFKEWLISTCRQNKQEVPKTLAEDLPVQNQSFTDAIKDFFKNVGVNFATIADNEILMNLITIAMPIVITIATAIGVTTNVGEKVAKAIVHTGNSMRATKTISESIGSLKKLIKDSVYTLAGKETDPAFAKIVEALDKLSSEIERKQQLLTERSGEALEEYGFIEDLLEQIASAKTLLSGIASENVNYSNLRLKLETLSNLVSELEKNYRSLMSTITGKFLPVTLWLYGKTGIGKSQCVATIVDAISHTLRHPVTTYVRNPANNNWDGYLGQLVTIYDDFNSTTDNLDHSELVQIYTEQEYQIRKAALLEKGQCFRSRFVII